MRTRSDLIEVDRSPMGPLAVLARIIDYLFGLLYLVLLVRLVLELINARHDTGFFDFVRRISDPFYAPFSGIVGTDTIAGARIVWPLVIAILAYMLLHAAVRALLRVVARA